MHMLITASPSRGVPRTTRLSLSQVAEFIHRGVGIAKEVNASGVGKKLADFKAALKGQEWPAITALRDDVEAFSAQFPTTAFDESSMRYPYKA